MRYLIIIIFMFGLNVNAQDSTSLLMMARIKDKIRTELIKKDSAFIDNIISQIYPGDCFKFQEMLKSHHYSNIVLTELCNRLIDLDSNCYGVILNNIDLFQEHPHSIRFNEINNFPVSKAVHSKDTNKIKLANYLLKSNYLNDCNFNTKHSDKFKKYLTYLLQSITINTDNINYTGCQKDNLLRIINLE